MALLADENIFGRDAYRRGTPAYEARLRAMLNAPIQGIAPGVGSLAPEGRPRLPSWVQARLEEQERTEAARKAAEAAAAGQAADQARTRAEALDRLAAANREAMATQPSTKRSKAVRPPAKPPKLARPLAARDPAYQRGTPQYWARLQEMLDAPIQGIAPGYGSLSEVGEPANWSEPEPRRPFSLLADQDDDRFGAAAPMSQSATTWWEPQEPEPPEPKPRRPFSPQADQDDDRFGAAAAPASGHGAWMFELTEGEEVTMTPSLEGYIPERLIERYKRVVREEQDPIGEALAKRYSEDALLRAWWIAYYETPGLSDQTHKARALRAGAPLPEHPGMVPQLLEDAADWGGHVGRDILAGVNQGQADLSDAELQQSDIVSDAIRAGLAQAWETVGPDGVGITPEVLARVVEETSDCEGPRIGRGGLIIYENCVGGTAPTFLDKFDSHAVTIGDTVFVDTTLKELEEFEEYYHYLKNQTLKDNFYAPYIWFQALTGYDKNPFEKEAKSLACRDYEKIHGRNSIWNDKCLGRDAPPTSALDYAKLYWLDPILDSPGVQIGRAQQFGEFVGKKTEDYVIEPVVDTVEASIGRAQEAGEALEEYIIDPIDDSLRNLNEHFGRMFDPQRWLPR